jgi:flagellar motor protein MotB
MFRARAIIRRGGRDEGERPFWISYADMMTALMVLFLLVISVALLAVTKTLTDAEKRRATHDRDIERLLGEAEQAARAYPGVHVDPARRVVDFGDKARFDTGSSSLTQDQARLLRAFTPRLLQIADEPEGRRWLKQVVVEGFTDRHGDYLYNLDLSLRRSERVLCVLLAPPPAGETPMSEQQTLQIRRLFLVGGYSFNSQKPTDDASRRIELRLEFLGPDETPPEPAAAPGGAPGACAI